MVSLGNLRKRLQVATENQIERKSQQMGHWSLWSYGGRKMPMGRMEEREERRKKGRKEGKKKGGKEGEGKRKKGLVLGHRLFTMS